MKKTFLSILLMIGVRQNPEAAAELEKNVRENFHKLMGNQSKIAARAAGRAVDVSADDFDDSDE